MMPWETSRPAPQPPGQVAPAAPPQQPYTYVPAPVPQYQPPTPEPPPAPQSAPGFNLQELVQQAVNSAVQQNKDQFVTNMQKSFEKVVDRKADQIEERIEDQVEALEGTFSGGVVTTRTFVQGAAIDIGFAALAAAATVLGPNTNVFDKEVWTLVGAMVLKTVIQTGMSYMMRVQAK